MSLLDTDQKLSANLLESFGWEPFKYPNKNPLFPKTIPWIPSTLYIKSYYDDDPDWPGCMKYDVFLGIFHKVVREENDTEINIFKKPRKKKRRSNLLSAMLPYIALGIAFLAMFLFMSGGKGPNELTTGELIQAIKKENVTEIVITPKARIILPQASSCKKISLLITKIPNTPDFVRIPDSNALAGAGATGWAFGNHI